MMSTTIYRLLVEESKFDQCDDSCGWIAAVIAALAYGTFGVPVKETVKIDVSPLILQSYKTTTMFLMSWLVIFMGESVRFTPWGLLSGLLWVLGGTGGIYAIRNAGMAIAVGTWSSIMILVNFFVGILFFQEPVASFFSTCGAFLCLAVGLVGMSVFSAPTKPAAASSSSTSSPDSSSSHLIPDAKNPLINHADYENQNRQQQQQQEIEFPPVIVSVPSADRSLNGDGKNSSNQMTARLSPSKSKIREDLGINATGGSGGGGPTTSHYDPLRDPAEATATEQDGIWRGRRDKTDCTFFWGDHSITFTKRQLGIMGAVINGALTGSSLVPIHYAKMQGFGGAAYMISFATGAFLSNLLIWFVWFATKMVTTTLHSQRLNSGTGGGGGILINLLHTYESMPAWHFKQLYIPGFSAGILLSIAMFGSIMAVTYLGQGVGNSIIQSKILISGLWGIFWYREIVGGMTIAKWFASAGLAVFGILWLSFERIHAKAVGENHF